MVGPVLHSVDVFVQLYSLVLLVRILLSWVPNVDRTNPIIQFIFGITDPVLEPVRRVLPAMGGLDLSPIVVFFGLHLLRNIVFNIAGH